MNAIFKHHALTTLLCVAFTAEIRAQLPNAWLINDGSVSSGLLQYQTNLIAVQVSSAVTNR